MVLISQIVGVAFFVGMLYLTFLFYKRGTYTRGASIVWTGVWAVGILLLIFPESMSQIVEELEFARATDLFVAIALMFFSMITFLNYAMVKRQERRIEELVRASAFRNPIRKRR